MRTSSTLNRFAAFAAVFAFAVAGASVATAGAAEAAAPRTARPVASHDVNGNETYTFVNHTKKFIDVNYRINAGTSYFKHLEPGGSWSVTADQTGTNHFVIASTDGPVAYGTVGFMRDWYAPYVEYAAVSYGYTTGAAGSLTLG